jgi:hypothetical protein
MLGAVAIELHNAGMKPPLMDKVHRFRLFTRFGE